MIQKPTMRLGDQKVYLKQGDELQIHGMLTVKLDSSVSGGYIVTEDCGNTHYFIDEADGGRSYPVYWPGQNAPADPDGDNRPYYIKRVPAPVTH